MFWVKVKDEFVPAQVTKEYRQMELIISSIIRNLATRCGSGQLSIHWPLFPEETVLGYTLTGGLCGVQTRSGRFLKQIRLTPDGNRTTRSLMSSL